MYQHGETLVSGGREWQAFLLAYLDGYEKKAYGRLRALSVSCSHRKSGVAVLSFAMSSWTALKSESVGCYVA
jgi:hypothetical protein